MLMVELARSDRRFLYDRRGRNGAGRQHPVRMQEEERTPARKTLMHRALVIGVVTSTTACYTGFDGSDGAVADTDAAGSSASGESAGGDDGLPPPPESEHEVGVNGMRRLTA